MGCKGLATGASRGLGFYAAEAMASLGCELIICARGEEGLRAAARELEEKYAVKVRWRRCDLRERESVEGLVRGAIEEMGEVNYVTMSYGNPSREPLLLHEASWEDWVEAYALYVASTATVMRELVLRNPAKATLVILSSFTSYEPMPPLVVADAARAGLSKLVRVAAREYAQKLRPLLVLIGSFDTPGARRTIERVAERRGDSAERVWREEVEA
ncbi:MAG: SDR family oxidoreductase, partial [Acidilobaceae archaeon]|nr:SDR family oxidoreductase [Acidilobaceae archaeon]